MPLPLIPVVDDADLRFAKRALGLDPSFQKARPVAAPTPGLKVVLSVRRGIGKIERFEHQTDSLNRTTAFIDAERAARDQGFTVWCHLDCYVPDETDQ